jgi:hypothetical protein
VLPHLGDGPKDKVTWMEVRLHKVGVGVVGLYLLPTLPGNLGIYFFVQLLNLGGELADFGNLLSFDKG